MKSWGITGLELAYTISRMAGLPAGRIKFQDFDATQLEVFLVRVPIDGIELTGKFRVGRVWMEPVNPSDTSTRHAIDTFDELGQTGFTCLASVLVTAGAAIDAETVGVEAIAEALDAVSASSLYSFSVHPDGQPLNFSRERLRARPSARPWAYVWSAIQSRGWARSLEPNSVLTSVDAASLAADWGFMTTHPASATLKLAFRALRSASNEQNSEAERLQALWNAVEFYVSGLALPDLVTQASLKRVKFAIKKLRLTSDETSRILDRVAEVNSPPLMKKLVEQAALDRSPLNQADRDVMGRLRTGRNHISHGRLGHTPPEEDLAIGVSVVARLLMHRWHGAAERAARPDGSDQNPT